VDKFEKGGWVKKSEGRAMQDGRWAEGRRGEEIMFSD
jgi:hypothetical protein